MRWPIHVSQRLLPITAGYSPLASSAQTGNSHFTARLKTLAIFWLPLPIQKRIWPANFKSARLYATSWLDGLRGVASLIVFFDHFTDFNCRWLTFPYDFISDGEKSWGFNSPLQLPFSAYSPLPLVPNPPAADCKQQYGLSSAAGPWCISSSSSQAMCSLSSRSSSRGKVSMRLWPTCYFRQSFAGL